MPGNSPQGRYWIGTIAVDSGWTPPTSLPDSVSWIKGQREVGEGGFHHWQLYASFSRAVRRTAVKSCFANVGHWELSRSVAAEAYVWKEDTRVSGTQFELGAKPFKRNSAVDWERVLDSAKKGDFSTIPADVQIKHYASLRRIAADFATPIAQERSCKVFWGKTGTGKSKLAWEEAGLQAYSKPPLTKWWCGYSGEQHVIIDEFRGVLSISHLLRWLDRYPVRVEAKGTSMPLRATHFWITSNLSPDDWYPEADDETKAALRRRLNITHFS